MLLILSLSLSLSVRIVHLRKKRSIIPSRPVRFFLRNKYACSHSNNDCYFACTIGAGMAPPPPKTSQRLSCAKHALCSFWKSSKLARQETHYNKVFIFTTLHGRFSFSSSSLSLSHLCMVRCTSYHWRKNGTADVEPGTELHISPGRIHTWGGEESSIGTAQHLGERFFRYGSNKRERNTSLHFGGRQKLHRNA